MARKPLRPPRRSSPLVRPVIHDPVNPSARAVNAVVVVAFASVTPVVHPDLAIGTGDEIETAEPGILQHHEILAVLPDIAVALALEDFHVDAAAVQVTGEKFAVVFLRPDAALVDEAAHVGVAAAELVGLVADALVDVVPFLRAAIPVVVVGGVADVPVGERIQMRAERAFVVGAGDSVPEVADYCVRVEKLAVLVPVHPPRIRAAVAENLEFFRNWMKAPDRAVHGNAVLIRYAGNTHVRGRGDAVATVEPAVGSELEAVDDVVSYRLGVEAVEHHDRLAIGDEVAVGIGDEEQLRRTGHPDTAVTDCDRGETFGFVPKDSAFVGFAVAVSVFEDDDTILKLHVPA